MKLIISGATGFIGRNLVKRLIKDEYEIHAVIRPTTNAYELNRKGIFCYTDNGDIEALIRHFSQNRYDGVIHLASVFISSHNPLDINSLISSNIEFGTRLLEASAKTGTPWFINTGTFWQHYQDKEYSPVNLYAATKQAFEAIARYYIEADNLYFLTIKLNDTFGPGDTRQKIFNLWQKISATGESLAMSPGGQIIDISYIDDIVDAYIQAIHLAENDKERIYNGRSFAVNSSERMNLRELSELFEKTTGKKLNIEWGKRPYREREVMTPWKKGEPVPEWKSRVSLAEGIAKTAAWVKKPE